MTTTFDKILSLALVKFKGQKYSENGVCSVMMNELLMYLAETEKSLYYPHHSTVGALHWK